MKQVLILSALSIAAGLLSGCEPAPSTPLAPEKKMPDVSKMSPAEVDKLLEKNNSIERK